MSSLRVLTPSEFQIVHDNLDIGKIAPILLDCGLLSTEDHEKLVKKTGKPAIKIITNKAKEHKEGAKLFQIALEKSKEHKGHQEILRVLFPADESTKKGIADIKLCGFVHISTFFVLRFLSTS